MLPNASLDLAAQRLDLFRADTLWAIIVGLPAGLRIVWQTSSAARLPVLQLMATSAPADARASATARPMPRDLPVTNAFFPIKLKSGDFSSVVATADMSVAMGRSFSSEE